MCQIFWFSEAYGRGIDGIILTALIAAGGSVLDAAEAVYQRLSSGNKELISRLPFSFRLRRSVSKRRCCDLWPL